MAATTALPALHAVRQILMVAAVEGPGAGETEPVTLIFCPAT
jgi:hypothetical protein